MTELDDAALMVARGRYSTIRAQHEEAKKRMQILVGTVTSLASQVLYGVQPKDESQAVDVSHLLAAMRSATDEIDECVLRIAELARQRTALRPMAWPR